MTIRGGTRQHRQRMAAVAGAGLLLFAATGCATAPAPAPTSAPPTAAPVFASDEEALAAATEAYANYQEMADQIDSDGGQLPERIAPFVSEQFLPAALSQSDGFRDANVRSVGSTTFVVDTAQEIQYADPADTMITLYICDDVTGVDVIDAAGTSVVSESRVPITPFEVSFVLDPSGDLVVDAREVWEGDNFC